jgi:hypothetical protein
MTLKHLHQKSAKGDPRGEDPLTMGQRIEAPAGNKATDQLGKAVHPRAGKTFGGSGGPAAIHAMGKTV